MVSSEMKLGGGRMKMKLGGGRMNVDAWLRGTLRGLASECATVEMNEWYVPVWIHDGQ